MKLPNDEIADLKRQRTQLLEGLDAAHELINGLLDEMLALHRYSNEPLPLKLLDAHEAFELRMKTIFEEFK
jgi:hypothetical protein